MFSSKLITRNLQEIIGQSVLEEKCNKGELCVYWGTATTGKPHVAYFVPIIKIGDMLKSGANVKILFANLHAYLDNMKAPWNLLKSRTEYYQHLIKNMLLSVNVPIEKLSFVNGTDFQLTPDYTVDVFRMCTFVSIHDAKKGGSETLKKVSDPLVAGLLYPLLQALDEEYLKCDAQFGGVDQRKIFMLAEKYLPHLGYKKRVHLMNPMIPGLTGDKMSSSDINSKIDLLDSSDSLKSKLNTALCSKDTSAENGNGLLAFVKYVVFPLNETLNVIDKQFDDFEQFETAFLQERVSVDELKMIIFKALDSQMGFVRDKFSTAQMQKLINTAYPEVIKTENNQDKDSIDFLNKMLNFKSSKAFEKTNQGKVLKIISDYSPLDYSKEFESIIDHCISKKDTLRISWSVDPSRMLHVGHLVPLKLIAKLSECDGVECVVIVKNLEAVLKRSITLGEVEHQGKLSVYAIERILKMFNANLERIRIVKETDFQFNSCFMLNFYRLLSLVPEKSAAIAAGVEASIVNPNEESEESSTYGSIKLAKLLVPILRMLNNYFSFTWISIAKLSSIQNQSIFEREIFPQFDATFGPPLYITTWSIPALQLSSKSLSTYQMESMVPSMRSKEATLSANALQAAQVAEDSTLSLFEPISPKEFTTFPKLKNRVKKAFCEPENVTNNPVLDIYKNLVIRVLNKDSEDLIIGRSEKNGGPLKVADGSDSILNKCTKLEEIFKQGELHPADLKAALVEVVQSMDSLLDLDAPNMASLLDAAFPKPQTKKTQNPPKNNKSDGPKADLSNRVLYKIGQIISVEKHPDADSLYVEKVNIGLEEPITVVSGLAGLFPMEKLQNRFAIFVCNLKPAKMRGIQSEAMLLCASHVEEDGTKVVHPLEVPATMSNSKSIGQRLMFREPSKPFDIESIPQPDKQLNAKVWDSVAEGLALGPDHKVQFDQKLVLSCSNGEEIRGHSDLPVGAKVK